MASAFGHTNSLSFLSPVIWVEAIAVPYKMSEDYISQLHLNRIQFQFGGIHCFGSFSTIMYPIRHL